MAKFALISLLSGIFFASAIQAVQVINNTSGIVTFNIMVPMASTKFGVRYCGYFESHKLQDIFPGTSCSLDNRGFASVAKITYPECAISAQHVQFDIGEIDETDTISFVEVDNTTIALKEHQGQVIQLKKEEVCLSHN